MTKYEYLTKFLICTFKYKGIGIKEGVFNDNSNCFYKKGFSADKMVDFNSFFGYALFDNNAYISHRNTKRGTHEEIETIDKGKLCHDISQFISEVHHIYVEKSAFEDGNIKATPHISQFKKSNIKNPSAKEQRDKSMLNYQPQGAPNQTDRDFLSARYRFANANII